MATYPNSRIQLRIDTEANWQSNHPTIAAGEICLSSDKKDFVVGSGAQWSNTNYWIANNPTVTSIRTTANNAQSAANTANNLASQARDIANMALEAAVGRVINTDIFKEHLDSKLPIEISYDILTKYQNVDFLANEFVVGASGEFHEIDFTSDVLTEKANELRFYFAVDANPGSNFYVKSSLFTMPSDYAAKLAHDGRIGILLLGDPHIITKEDDNIVLTFPRGAVVELRYINGFVLKYSYSIPTINN